MPEITLAWDSRSFGILKDQRIKRAMISVVNKAGGDALRALRVESSRFIRGKKRFKVSRVNKGLPLFYPGKKKDLERLIWTMKVNGTAVPISDFPHRQTKKGVSVQVNTGARRLIKSAFIATMKSGHTGVFRRRGAANLPIDEVFSTRLSDVFNYKNPPMVPQVQAKAGAAFKSSFDRLFAIEVKRGFPGDD